MTGRVFHMADMLKAAFIDFVIDTFDDDVVIGHEVMYGSSGRFADLVLLYHGATYAVEIKSDSDSLSRLEGQIQEYRKQFNYIIVVCGEKHKEQLKNSLPKGIGLYHVCPDSSIQIIKKPHKNLRLDKDEMLYSVRVSYLAKRADFPTSNIGAVAIRRRFTKKTVTCVQEILYEFWQEKITPGFNNFMSDRGAQTTPNDLSSFSSLRVSPIY